MASQGIKRVLEYEFPPAQGCGGPSGASTSGHIMNMHKKRCTSYIPPFDRPQLGFHGQHTSPFKDPSTVLTPLNDDINHIIKNEMIHNRTAQVDHHNRSTSTNLNDPPVFTARQTRIICEKIIKEREQKLREEYDKILISKLSEQYDTFVKYTHDHIEKRYNESNSHQSSYLS